MLNNEAAAAEAVQISVVNSRTASSNGSWFDVRKYEGDLLFTQVVGLVSGTTPTLDGKIQDADDSGGTNTADITGATFTQVTATGAIQTVVVPANRVRGWVRYSGTIAGTTPNFAMTCTLHARPKIV